MPLPEDLDEGSVYPAWWLKRWLNELRGAAITDIQVAGGLRTERVGNTVGIIAEPQRGGESLIHVMLTASQAIRTVNVNLTDGIMGLVPVAIQWKYAGVQVTEPDPETGEFEVVEGGQTFDLTDNPIFNITEFYHNEKVAWNVNMTGSGYPWTYRPMAVNQAYGETYTRVARVWKWQGLNVMREYSDHDGPCLCENIDPILPTDEVQAALDLATQMAMAGQ